MATQVTIQEAASMARRQYLQVEGIVAVSHVDNMLVFYVESEEDRAKVPPALYGYPVTVKVVGRVRLL